MATHDPDNVSFERTETTVVKPAPVSETTAIFRRLRELKATLGPKADRNEVAATLISACIMDGIDTRLRIVRALETIGLNPRHVVIVLNHQTGRNPVRHRWSRNDRGRYWLLDADRSVASNDIARNGQYYSQSLFRTRPLLARVSY